MDALKIGAIVLIGYICVYSIIDRICKCVENRAMSNAYNTFLKNFDGGVVNEQSGDEANSAQSKES